MYNTARLETIIPQDCCSEIAKDSGIKLLVVDSATAYTVLNTETALTIELKLIQKYADQGFGTFFPIMTAQLS
jgi:hypothetical protein